MISVAKGFSITVVALTVLSPSTRLGGHHTGREKMLFSVAKGFSITALALTILSPPTRPGG